MIRISKIDDKFSIYKENTVVLLGIGQGTKQIFDLFKYHKININYICDNNKDNWGKVLENIPVISPPQLQQLAQSKNSQISGGGGEFVVQIATSNIDNSIEQQLKAIGIEHIISFNQALKLFNYVPPQPQISKEQAEFNAKNKRYTDSLRGLNNDKFPLLKPEDMPEHAKEMVKKLEYLKQSYLAGENFYIDKEKTMLLQDFCSRGYMNGVSRIGGYQGQLVFIEKRISNEISLDVDKAIENVSNLSNYLNKINIPFLYFQFPCKLSPVYNNLYYGISNDSNRRASKFVEGLKMNGVNVFDFRKYMIDNNIDFEDCFYKTDQHWKTRVAFNSTKIICKEIEKLIKIEFDWDKLDINNYESIIYPNIFLGSHGKKTGILYSGVDDFELLLPKFETEYTWFSKGHNFKKNGSAAEALLYQMHLDWNYNLLNTYAVHSLTHQGHTIIQNNNTKSKDKILFINDSFSNPISSFISTQFCELHFLDLRGNRKDLFGIIEELKPNIVVMLYATSSYINQQCMTDVNPKDYI